MRSPDLPQKEVGAMERRMVEITEEERKLFEQAVKTSGEYKELYKEPSELEKLGSFIKGTKEADMLYWDMRERVKEEIPGHINQAGGYCCPHFGNTCGYSHWWED